MCIRDSFNGYEFVGKLLKKAKLQNWSKFPIGDVVAKVGTQLVGIPYVCLLYTSDAADERSSVDLGGRRIIKKKKIKNIDVNELMLQ